jgi:hypothetical protein
MASAPAGEATDPTASVAGVEPDLATAPPSADGVVAPTADPTVAGRVAPPSFCPAPPSTSAPVHTSPADLRMRRLLRLPIDAPKASEASARSLVERSLLISMVRCLLTYVVLPFVAPILGIGLGATPLIGIPVGLVAIVANIASVRRFWRADHRYRWHYTALASVIIVLLVWLIVVDVAELLS